MSEAREYLWGANTEKPVIRFDKCLWVALKRGIVKNQSGLTT